MLIHPGNQKKHDGRNFYSEQLQLPIVEEWFRRVPKRIVIGIYYGLTPFRQS